MEYTTQRVSKTNVEKVNDMADGENFNTRLEKILDTVEYWTDDLIEETVEDKIKEASQRGRFWMIDVTVVDSMDGFNPVLKIELETEEGTQVMQLTRYEAAKLANKLVETFDNIEDNN